MTREKITERFAVFSSILLDSASKRNRAFSNGNDDD